MQILEIAQGIQTALHSSDFENHPDEDVVETEILPVMTNSDVIVKCETSEGQTFYVTISESLR